MSLRDLLSGLPDLYLDPRLEYRGKGQPGAVTTVRVEGALGGLMDRALKSDPVPVAIVESNGRAVVLTSGESGVIWTVGEPSGAQEARVGEIGDALAQVSGLSLTGVVAPKKKKAKAVEDVSEEPVAEEPAAEEPVEEPAPEPDQDGLVIGEI